MCRQVDVYVLLVYEGFSYVQVLAYALLVWYPLRPLPPSRPILGMPYVGYPAKSTPSLKALEQL